MVYDSNKNYYYFKRYYDNIELGKAFQSPNTPDGYQASAIIVKPFGVNRNIICGRFTTPTLRQFLEHTITKGCFEFILGKYALLIVKIMSLLEKGAIEKDSSSKAFFYIGDNIFTSGPGICVVKYNEKASGTYNDYENIKILVDKVPQIKVSRHSFRYSKDISSLEHAKAIPISLFDEIKDMIFAECSDIYKLLLDKLNKLEHN